MSADDCVTVIVEEVPQVETVTELVPEIIVEPAPPEIEVIVDCGAQGPPGPGSIPQTLTKIAGEALGGHRAVYVASDGTLRYADSQVATARVVAGITTGAAAAGDPTILRYAGEMVEAGWSWVPEGTIYLGTTGQLTQTPPTTGTVVEMGVALTATSMLVRIQISLLLE